jgi:glutathione S-transferase
MLTLYHKPGSCSLASHIVLEESGEPYALQPVDLAAGEQRTEAFLKINPQGRVPVLILDDGHHDVGECRMNTRGKETNKGQRLGLCQEF